MSYAVPASNEPPTPGSGLLLVRISSPSEFPAQPQPEEGQCPQGLGARQQQSNKGAAEHSTPWRQERAQEPPAPHQGNHCAVNKHPQLDVICEKNILVVFPL